MKKIWLILLSLGLVMAFSVSAFAVDVKVGAEYLVGGLYLDRTSVNDGWRGGTIPNSPIASYYHYRPTDNTSTAFFYQRLRVGTDFVVSPCLKLVTRFTAMERVWGGPRSNGYEWAPNVVTENTGGTSGTREEAENIAFDLAYIEYVSPIGMFRVGYQPDYVWGTAFGDRANGKPAGQIIYAMKKGPFTFILDYAKEQENNYTATNNSWRPYLGGYMNPYATDRDLDSTRIAGIYEFKGGETGLLFLWNRDATHRGMAMTDTFPLYVPIPYMSNVYFLDPYVKVKIGPVDVQAEAQYWFGKAAEWEITVPVNEVDVDAWSFFVDANATFGKFYVGASFAYLTGDDPSTNDKIEGGINTAGLDWNPCLIMFNTDLNFWAGDITGHTNSVVNGEMSNALFFQVRGGIRPIPQLDINLAIAHAEADQDPNPYPSHTYRTYASSDYGTEIDVTATYKITNNLTYMVGLGYLITGDYFKGYDRPGHGYEIDDDYILINKLTLSF